MKIDPWRPGTTEIAINSRVELRSDEYAADGATRGMIGYVIERYPDGNLEVEFSNSKTGETIVGQGKKITSSLMREILKAKLFQIAQFINRAFRRGQRALAASARHTTRARSAGCG